MTGEPQWALASRVVFPVDHDEDLLPLYVEFGRRYPGVDDTHDEKVRTWGEAKASGTPASAGIEGRSDDVLSRTSFAIRPGQRVSFATYFNAFPASYWRRWTTAERVRLRVAVEGEATVLVYRSNARGSSIRLHRFTTGAPSANHPSERTEPTVVEVDLDPARSLGVVGGSHGLEYLSSREKVGRKLNRTPPPVRLISRQ